MTLWPQEPDADQAMWDAYKKRTARPGLLEQEESERRAREEAQQKAAQPPAETPQRRGRVSDNPQPERDA